MNPIASIAETLVAPITELVGKFIPDKDKAAELAHDLATLASRQAHENRLAQIEVNKREADSKSLFKGGWRPFVGWVCGFALANNYLIVPYAKAFGLDVPTLDFAVMMPVLLGMLGLGTMRTVERNAGKTP